MNRAKIIFKSELSKSDSWVDDIQEGLLLYDTYDMLKRLSGHIRKLASNILPDIIYDMSLMYILVDTEVRIIIKVGKGEWRGSEFHIDDIEDLFTFHGDSVKMKVVNGRQNITYQLLQKVIYKSIISHYQKDPK